MCFTVIVPVLNRNKNRISLSICWIYIVGEVRSFFISLDLWISSLLGLTLALAEPFLSYPRTGFQVQSHFSLPCIQTHTHTHTIATPTPTISKPLHKTHSHTHTHIHTHTQTPSLAVAAAENLSIKHTHGHVHAKHKNHMPNPTTSYHHCCNTVAQATAIFWLDHKSLHVSSLLLHLLQN